MKITYRLETKLGNTLIGGYIFTDSGENSGTTYSGEHNSLESFEEARKLIAANAREGSLTSPMRDHFTTVCEMLVDGEVFYKVRLGVHEESLRNHLIKALEYFNSDKTRGSWLGKTRGSTAFEPSVCDDKVLLLSKAIGYTYL